MMRRDAGAVELACLESMYGALPHRGFEPLSLRQII